MKLKNIKTVYISGASKGIGFEWAKWFLKNNMQVVGVARNNSPLVAWATAEGLETQLTAINFDLSQIDSLGDLHQQLDQFDFDLMINNAGFGGVGDFIAHDEKVEMNMIDLNIKSLHIMTKYFDQKYSACKGEKRIINLGSIAAFMPGPGHATYFATKAYVLSLSSAVNFELQKQKSNLRIVTICPGSISTDFWTRADFKHKKMPIGTMSVSKFTKLSLRKMLTTKKSNWVVGRSNRFMLRMMKFIPVATRLNIIYKSQK